MSASLIGVEEADGSVGYLTVEDKFSGVGVGGGLNLFHDVAHCVTFLSNWRESYPYFDFEGGPFTMRSRFRQEFLWSEKLGAGWPSQAAYPEPDTTPSQTAACDAFSGCRKVLSPDKINLDNIVNLGNI